MEYQKELERQEKKFRKKEEEYKLKLKLENKNYKKIKKMDFEHHKN